MKAINNLRRAVANMQDLGAVVHELLITLRVGSQAQKVGVEGYSDRMLLTHVNLFCQMALLLHAGLIRLKAPEVTHLHHLDRQSPKLERMNPVWFKGFQRIDLINLIPLL